MNVVIFTLVLLFIFYIIQRNSNFQNKDYPINSGERGKDITSGFDKIFQTETRKEKKIKLLNAIRNISESDKVVLTEVVDKWSLNKNVIDPGTNKQSIEIIKDVMEKILSYLNGPLVSVDEEKKIIPKNLNILSLYPNPSNQAITIEFKVEQISLMAYLSITDLMGREVLKMSVQPLAAKTQKLSWHGQLKNGQDAPSGMYIAKLSQGNQLVTKKFTLLK